MNDPHIDIDDLDSVQAKTGPSQSEAKDYLNQAKYEPEMDWETESRFGSAGGGVFKRLRDQAGFGMGSGGLDDLFPGEAREHFRASQREFLLGWRTLIDRAISRIDEREQRVPSATPGANPNKIIVEEIDI